MRKLAFLLSALAAAPTLAQDDTDQWLRNGRPECSHGIAAHAAYSHRSSYRVGIGSQADAPMKATGTKKVPVVLVAFADKPFTAADGTAAGVKAFYQKFCNGTMDGVRYMGHGSYGSIRDYFVEQSDSAFLPEFTVMGPVTLSKGYAVYGRNTANSKDVGFNAFRSEAITLAQQAYTGSWTDFDNDGNGTVDMIFFIYAGLGESNGGDADCIWPKETTAAVTINGMVYSCSAVTCEARPATYDESGHVLTTKTDGVGVFIHEFSHALGLPDFYDTNNKAFGMDLWSVMDYGQYGGNGYNPGNYTAYERDFMGWRKLIDVDEPCVLTIPCFADGGTGYRILNDANAQEYYIIENRQAKGWDGQVCRMGHGLQVTHVDYAAARWNNNTVNTDLNHQRMTIVAANNNYKGTNSVSSGAEWRETLAGNLYPGSTLNYSLTDTSTPAAQMYTGGLLGKPLRNITENADGTMTVCFRTNGQLTAPVVDEAEDIQMNSFTARWQTVENATKYVCELYREDLFVRRDTLTATSLNYTQLQPSTQQKYRVQALADAPEDYLPSAWSEYSYLQTLADLIEGVDESVKRVVVYSLNGQPVASGYADEVGRLALRPGIYVVRYSNGNSNKVLIK